ncbi:MAG: DUF4199 domain-containing protein [Gammaproteobacteria bacterium]|nr:DUF4199 domain-containing protein [Gammaproteobacteria bacterium]
MKRIILIYGTVAGLVIIVTNTLNLEFGRGQAWLGFLVMFIAFSTIYVSTRQYRDQTLGGVISFTTALSLGLGISAIASIVYVAVWEVYLAITDYGFIESYIDAIVEAGKLSGASEADMAEVMLETEQIRVQYANPLFRLPMTLIEVFPAGLLISLISAAVLRNHKTAGQ